MQGTPSRAAVAERRKRVSITLWRRAALLGALCLFGAGLPACATSDAEALAQVPPAGSPLARLTVGMNADAVRNVLGEPHDLRDYETWQAWNPFYFGPDTARTDWIYAGEGRVVFARNRYSGRLKLLRVAYEPDVES